MIPFGSAAHGRAAVWRYSGWYRHACASQTPSLTTCSVPGTRADRGMGNRGSWPFSGHSEAATPHLLSGMMAIALLSVGITPQLMLCSETDAQLAAMA